MVLAGPAAGFCPPAAGADPNLVRRAAPASLFFSFLRVAGFPFPGHDEADRKGLSDRGLSKLGCKGASREGGRIVFTLPWRGRVARKGRAGWGEERSSAFHPLPIMFALVSENDRPPPSRGR